MNIATMHPEDVKAGIRKRFGSIANFERTKGLPEKSVNDVLRGRPSARVKDALEEALNSPTPIREQSEVSDYNATERANHRLNAGAR